MIRIGTRETISPIFAAALARPCPWCKGLGGRRMRAEGIAPSRVAAARASREESAGHARDLTSGRASFPGVAWGSAGNAAVAHPAGATARQVPGAWRLFALVTAIVLLFFGCVR